MCLSLCKHRTVCFTVSVLRRASTGHATIALSRSDTGAAVTHLDKAKGTPVKTSVNENWPFHRSRNATTDSGART